MEKQFTAIFIQTANLLDDLSKLGVQNLYITSNPKRLNTCSITDLRIWDEKEVKVCVFSRIYKDKGIKDAVEAVKITNKRLVAIKLRLIFMDWSQIHIKKS